jgi:hypothetical protein
LSVNEFAILFDGGKQKGLNGCKAIKTVCVEKTGQPFSAQTVAVK